MGKDISQSELNAFFERQLSDWDTAKNNYEALNHVKVKDFVIGQSTVKVQFNPARIVSSAAKVDTKSLKERKCFLCEENRPSVQEGIEWGGYTVLINPFPIFPRHLTIPCNQHTPQRIKGRMADMMELARQLEGFTLFYNGPKCGASAPDHMHFQAGNRDFMPIEHDFDKSEKISISSGSDSVCSVLTGLAESCILIEANSVAGGVGAFDRIYECLDIPEGEEEPMLNILCYFDNDAWRIFVFPRKKHRPTCYFAEDDENILISPASVDMGGMFITPLEKDFNKITAADIKAILDEVCLSKEEIFSRINKI